MVIQLQIQRGVQFKPNVYKPDAPQAWLDEVGKALEKNGVSVRVGQGSGAMELKSAADVQKFYQRFADDPDAAASAVGLPVGVELQAYLADLIEALDDVVASGSLTRNGDLVDLSTRGTLAKTLGLSDSNIPYAGAGSPFGDNTGPGKAMTVMGVRLSPEAALPDPLEGKAYMDASVFASTASRGYGRDAQEYEAVRHLAGVDSAALLALVRSERGGRSVLKRMRKAKDVEAFSLGYRGVGIDQMRWDKSAHAIRQANPFVSLTVEANRFEPDPKDGEREVSQGTDYFWDRYYRGTDPSDAGKDLLLDNDMMVRARVRYDQPGKARRVLIQAKVGSTVDERGMKSAAKKDIRKDIPSAKNIENMDRDLRSGVSTWGYNPQPIGAMEMVYKELASREALPNIGPHDDVLLLEVGAHVFSQRSRYHLNETDPAACQRLFANAETQLGKVKTLVEASTSLSDSDRKSLLQDIAGLLDHSAILQAVREPLAALDAGKTPDQITLADIKNLWPSARNTVGKGRLAALKIVTDAIDQAYDAFAGKLNDARRDIANRDGAARKFKQVDEMVDFLKQRHSNMSTTTTVEPFIAQLDQALKGPEAEAFIKDFGEHMAAQGDDRYKTASDPRQALGLLRTNMVNAQLDIVHRQIEAAGSMAQKFWFDQVRRSVAHAAPSSSYSNFLIDTFDYVEDIRPKDWDSLSDEQRDGRAPIPADKVYHADLVSEVQIELDFEKPFLKAIDKAEAALDAARGNLMLDFALAQGASVDPSQPETLAAFVAQIAHGEADAPTLDQLNAFIESKGSPLRFDAAALGRLDAAQLAGVKADQPVEGHAELVEDARLTHFVWDTMRQTQESIADLRGRRVLREAKRGGLTGVDWTRSEMSKGETAMRNI